MAIQFEHPEWSDVFDDDDELAQLTRRRLRQELAQPLTIGIGTHLADSVFGVLTPHHGTYQWNNV
ncbi:MAG TPA: hypothetical protein VFV38_02300 [Ktedonobacteraceae bacterium]|nr:hypothetical protein [Ktedonobacteraceae bacterium]